MAEALRHIILILRSRVTVALLLAITALGVAQAPSVELRDITIVPGKNSATVTFLVTGGVQTVVLEPKPGGIAQIRMKSVKASAAALASAAPKPGVKSVKAHIERTDVLVTNVTFTRAITKMEVIKRDNEIVKVLVRLGSPLVSTSQSTASASTNAGATGSNRAQWSLSTIVIDAGHGGKDPGAIGIGDIREKDITLTVAKKLRDEIKRTMRGVKVVMTRDTDTFVELYRRGQIANEKGGRLFISLHCNAMPEKPNPVSGFECYILRPGRSEDAARVAAQENSAIQFEADQKKYEGMTAESAIVASMAQSAFARYSEELASALQKTMNKATAIPNRGVHQAGFYVLVGASMPAVLVELGYISNTNDANILKSATGQERLAKAIAEGIRKYEKIYSSSLK